MRKRWIYLCTALILLAGACMTGAVTSGAAPADPVDLEAECSLTVRPVDLTIPEKQEYWEDMQNAHIVLDLYKVAGAGKVGGYDTYTFVPEPGYSLDISDYSVLQELTAEDWEDLAQKAAETALQDGKALETGEASETGTSFDSLSAGLYLVVARGDDLEPSAYTKMMKQEVPEGETGEPEEKLVTIANSARYEYAFTPQLIALPTKGEYEGEISTANPLPWVYGAEVFLKSGRNPRYGSLEIVKTLRNYESVEGTIEPVTFIFRVVGMLDGEEVYNEVDSITFSEEGNGRTRLEGIPATAQVTVTEEYSGISYTQVIPPDNGSQSAVIVADADNSVTFENVYNEHRTHGHGIKNRFVYHEAEDTWGWYPDPEQQGGQEAE